MSTFAKIKPLKRVTVNFGRLMVILGTLAVFNFLWWFFQDDHIGNIPLFIALALTIGFKLMRMLFEWYHYAFISVPQKQEELPSYTVDMLTTFVPGEPYEMIEKTLTAMVAVQYPHTTYLCDEGNDPYLKDLCKRLGVIHVYRGEDKTNAKAGNINFALDHHATGEIAVILDPDHIPVPEFLDRVLPYFQEEEIGYVQCVQGYYNRNESFVAKAAAEQTYMFYGPMMMGMNTHGTTQAIGANCAFRRAALDSIGGHAPGLCEDMHTSMLLHANKWKSIYLPEMLTRGLVPATISAYFKQQLKWSRGAFELLFEVLPKIFKDLTWKQRIHYLVAPLYYFYGLIGLLDILIPVIALFTFATPLLIEFDQFLLYVTPVIFSSLFIRQYVQRFVLEDHEMGFHFLGGLLRIGTWWVFLTGFVYSIFKIKVPYIPTPKGDELRNEWKLSTPNLLAILLSMLAIVVGLSYDWNPHSWLMAGFAGVNALLLSIVVLISQQKSISRFYQSLYHGRISPFRKSWYLLRHNLVYKLLRSHVVAAIIALGIASLFTLTFVQVYPWAKNQDLLPVYKTQQVPLLSIPREGNPHMASLIKRETQGDHLSFEKYSLPWMHQDSARLTRELLSILSDSTRAVWINFLPTGVEGQSDQALQLRNFYQYLTSDSALHDLKWLHGQLKAQESQIKILLSFEVPPLSTQLDSLEQTAFTYQLAWRKLFESSLSAGISDLTWIWGGENLLEKLKFYPGTNYLNMIDLPFEVWANSVHNEWIDNFQLPVIITGIPPETPTEDLPLFQLETQQEVGTEWIVHGLAIEGSERLYPREAPIIEVHDRHKDNPSSSPSPFIALKIKESTIIESPSSLTSLSDSDTQTFSLFVNDKPFYIRGMAYNPEHDWRDGFWPLTREQLDHDFSKIKEMGANTIRRYSPSVYDYNIFSAAREHELKVIYGFWFDPKIDYLQDKEAVLAYKLEVLEKVREFKENESIICWGVGNETWGLLKHQFNRPYLHDVRGKYIQMIQEIAEEIRKIDPQRPILTAMEFSRELPVGMQAFYSGAPNLSGIAVNTYYPEDFEELDELCAEFFPGKPYLVSEYGPKGYWDVDYTKKDEREFVIEESSFEKARLYVKHWNRYIEPHRGQNLGGVAYCWRDRMDGTATWFGITDYKGRVRPAYYALRNLWMARSDTFPLADLVLTDRTNYTLAPTFRTYGAISANNHDQDLTYEWYLCRNEYLSRMGESSYKAPGTSGSVWFDLKRKYAKFSHHLIYPDSLGRGMNVKYIKDDPDQRMYLHISDGKGHVVSASYKIE